jgi:hypothetical protein
MLISTIYIFAVYLWNWFIKNKIFMI